MNIETKFTVGQTVWPVFLRSNPNTQRCMHCGNLPFPGAWLVTGRPRTVGQIHAQYVNFVDNEAVPTQRTIHYRFSPTGPLYAEEDVFNTREEAEAEAARRNAKLKETEE